MAASPEQKKNYQVVKAFRGMNTRPNRTAIDDTEFSWLENMQPIGFGNIKAVPISANVTVTGGNAVVWSNTVSALYSVNLRNEDYIIAFQQNGGAEYYNIDTSTKGTLANSSTFSAGDVRLRQWKAERAIIADPNKGYFSWDGTNLVSVGSLGSIGITNPGSGYTEPPTVTVSAPNEAGGNTAIILATISNAAGTITNMTINNGGTGYTSFPTISIAEPTTPYGVRAEAVVSSITSNAISSVSVTNPGYGYTAAPTVTISGGGGSNANITTVLGSGIVTGLTVTDAGSGYTSSPTITITGGGGNNATAIAGFLTFATGTIGIALEKGGSGYSSTPTVVIDAAPAGGVNAAATAIVYGGVIQSVIVTNPGKGYNTAPTVTFSGGSPTANAVAKAVLTEDALSDVASFQGRVWLSQGRRVYYSAAGSFSDYISVSAGNIELSDDTLHSNITALISANNFLYVFGDNSIDVFSDVTVSAQGLTNFTKTNVSASTGSVYKDGIFPYFRSLLFMNDYGIFALIGATVSKISDALDGVFQRIDFNQPITSGQVLVNNILCAAFNCYYNDPDQGLRPIQLVFFDKKWFVTNQGTIKRMTSVANGRQIYLYGTNQTNLVRFYANATANISTMVQSALWPMQDTIRDKQALKFGIEATTTVSATLNVTVDSEYNSSPIYVMSNIIYWVNNSGQTIPWTNNASATIQWLGGTAYTLYKSDAQQYGKYLGLTITSTSPSYTINTLEMEYELRARF